jgi:hypothetical protein
MAVPMDFVATYNDLVGGVEVTVLDDFGEIDPTLVKGEKVTLTGEHALTYVRSRKGLDDSTNNTRMERQKQYLNALYEKTLDCIEKDDEFIVKAALEASELESDRSVTRLQELMEKLSTYEFLGIQRFEGELQIGEKFVEFYPQKESVDKIVVENFYEKK